MEYRIIFVFDGLQVEAQLWVQEYDGPWTLVDTADDVAQGADALAALAGDLALELCRAHIHHEHNLTTLVQLPNGLLDDYALPARWACRAPGL
jgi:hypothetical protein